MTIDFCDFGFDGDMQYGRIEDENFAKIKPKNV